MAATSNCASCVRAAGTGQGGVVVVLHVDLHNAGADVVRLDAGGAEEALGWEHELAEYDLEPIPDGRRACASPCRPRKCRDSTSGNTGGPCAMCDAGAASHDRTAHLRVAAAG